MRLTVRSAALLLVGFVLAAVILGCSSHHKSARQKSSGRQVAGVDVIAKNASSVLHGRRLAFGFGTSDFSDIWVVLEHGRLAQVSKKVRETKGGTCSGGPYGSGSGPCYQYAEPFSLSPDGKHIAFFLVWPVNGVGGPSPALIVSRSDGSHPRDVATNLGYAALSSLGTPSWDRDSRSFVIFAPTTGLDPNSQEELSDNDEDTSLFRVELRSGKATPLTKAGVETYNYAYPSVSPDGRRIAFLRSVTREPSAAWDIGVTAFVYVMQANGSAPSRLPFPARDYASLWWCGNSTTLCADSATKELAASANTYRVDLRTGRVTRMRHWAEARYSAVSADGTFAVDERKTARGAEVFVGPVSAAGVARFRPVLEASHARKNPFFGFSVSRP